MLRRAALSLGLLFLTSAVGADTGYPAKALAAYKSPMCIAMSPKGDFAYVTNHTAGTLSVIDTRTDKPTGEIAVGRTPTGVAVSPDG